MERKTSKHIVTVFDPNRDPSVPGALNEAIQKDARVSGLKAPTRLGLVKTDKGTYWLDDEGCGSTKTVESRGCPVEFHREFVDGSFEPFPNATATFSLEECLACATGETLTLDKFIGFGRRKDENFATWEAQLS